MTSGASYKSMQWLYYLQATSPLLSSTSGNRMTIQHKYNHGEKLIQNGDNDDLVDGYCVVDGQVYIYEFLGCFWHYCSCQTPKTAEDRALGEKRYFAWLYKKRRLERNGQLITIWECEWDHALKTNPGMLETKTHFPGIMHQKVSDDVLLESVRNETFFGFIHCDLW